MDESLARMAKEYPRLFPPDLQEEIMNAPPERRAAALQQFSKLGWYLDTPDTWKTINDPSLAIDERCLLVIRGAGPMGWPGAAEVVNMQPPDHLIQKGITSLPTLGDGRQSGTSDSPSILNATPESAAGGGLVWLRTGDIVRIDLNAGRCEALVPDEEIAKRRTEGPPPMPPSQTPWQALYRATVGPLADGAVIEEALEFRDTARTLPRHNH